MEIIIFCGLQGSGKSTFYVQNFFNTHVRISMDLLNTRNKEAKFLDTCFALQQAIVIDNTNPTLAVRSVYIEKAKAKKYKVIGYYFQSRLQDCLSRNKNRIGKAKVNERGILATAKQMEIPAFHEGFDELLYVSLNAENQFVISPWQYEL